MRKKAILCFAALVCIGLNATAADLDITNGTTFTNPADASYENINNEGTLSNDSVLNATTSLINSGNIENSAETLGTLNISGGENTGSITQGILNFTGDFTNNGTITAKQDFSNSANLLGNNGKLILNGGENNGSITQGIINFTGDFTNNGKITVKQDFSNSGNLTGTLGKLTLNGGSNSGSITQDSLTNSKNTFTNEKNIKVNSFTNAKLSTFVNENTLEATGIYNKGVLYNNNSIVSNGILENTKNGNSAIITNNGSLNLNELKNSGEIINKNNIVAATINNYGKIENLNGQISADKLINNETLTLNNSNGIFKILDNQGKININNSSSLTLTDQVLDVNGTINSIGGQNTLTLGDNINFNGVLNVGNNTNTTSLELLSGNLAPNATLNILSNAELISNNSASQITFNNGDNWSGKVNLKQGNVTLDGFKTSNSSYAQSGGVLNIINDSSLTLKDISEITSGEMNIDATSSFVSQSENGIMNLDALNTSGLFSAMNSDIGAYAFQDLNIGGNAVGTVSNQANFTIDVFARSNQYDEHATDQFIGNNINGNGTINISDWRLGDDIFGWDAPIDRDFELGKIFNYSNISPNIKLTATKKEVFTPIGWYQLNNYGGISGNYTLNLTRFNPQVYRGQVTTLSQYMNQLVISDMLFNHSMLLPSFKDDDLSDNGTMINRLAAANPVYAPYQYSKKDGGLWYRMYGTFETLQMSQGLSRVGNNAYGTIIGADFGLKDLKHGWKFMPTAYIGYNGAHQYFAGMGAYQNGGQAGFLGTWYKNNFVLGGLIYGGVYQNSMDIAGHVDNTFNYFAGASAKGAYNWRLHRDWVLQPNLMLAYNFFGQQNWHTDFGQMGMMSGTLNGINLAPGLNLIWEKETFSIYATLQYMYNLNGAVDGRAGNVSLPHLYMDRGYIQYGFGFTKRFTDRFSGYFQTVFRNVGRTGVGFQLGLNIKLGK